MQKIITMMFVGMFALNVNAQVNTSSENSVLEYLGKYNFSTSELGGTVYITYDYISSYNTYGIIVSNTGGTKQYFMNVNVRSGYGSALATGMNLNGQDFTVKVTSSGTVSSGGIIFRK